MVHIIKVYLEHPTLGKQIRRLAISSDVVSSIGLLSAQIGTLFQLTNGSFEMKWKDSEDDLIVMSSDGELAQALAHSVNTEDGLFRVYISLKSSMPKVAETVTEPKIAGLEHPLVVCDACDRNIHGERYKCLQCRNFDLCSACNKANKHADHDMIKLVKPSHFPRDWVYLGARRMWKSMFGRCPSSSFAYCQAEKESAPPSKESSPPAKESSPPERESSSPRRESSPPGGESSSSESSTSSKSSPGDHPLGGSPLGFMDFLKGDFKDTHKIIQESLETLWKQLPGGIEVKVDNKYPFRTECKIAVKTQQSEGKAKESKAPEKPTPSTFDNVSKPEEPLPKTEIKTENTVKAPEVLSKSEDTKVHEENEGLKETETETPEAEVPCTTETKTPEVSPSASCESSIKGPFAKDFVKEISPASDIEASACPEGWTFLETVEHDKQEVPAAANQNDKVIEPEKVVAYPVLEEVQKIVKEPIVQSRDPKIIDALTTMRAMGFTNEGGWLERLLVTKQGNINEALDALYPFTQRH